MKDYNADRLQNILRSVRRSALPFYRRTARVLVLKATMSGRHWHRPTFCFGVLPFATPNISSRQRQYAEGPSTMQLLDSISCIDNGKFNLF